MNTSWKTEVFVDGSWSSNALRFATKDEAVAYGIELLSRWWVPSDKRAVESDEPVNYKFDNVANKAVALEKA